VSDAHTHAGDMVELTFELRDELERDDIEPVCVDCDEEVGIGGLFRRLRGLTRVQCLDCRIEAAQTQLVKLRRQVTEQERTVKALTTLRDDWPHHP
jgi:hypothetical protein